MNSVSGIICLVKDLETSVAFYETLGFVLKKRVPDIAATVHLNSFWIEFLLEDRVVTEALKSDVPISSKGAGQYIHINVEDVDEFYEDVIAKGLRPLSRPQDFPWGHREFVVQDPSGYKLVLYTRINKDIA